jgi:hypothetical protein
MQEAKVAAALFAGCVTLGIEEIKEGTDIDVLAERLAARLEVLGVDMSDEGPLGLDAKYATEFADEFQSRIVSMNLPPQRNGLPAPTRMPQSGHVYLIENTVTGSLKIGFSRNPTQRLESLQTSCEHPLRLLGSFLGCQSDETSLHHEFDTLRLAGEWFHPSQEIHDRFTQPRP